MHTINLSIKRTLGTLAACSLFILSCQKKFDAKSYAPAQTFGGFSSSSQIEPSSLVAHFAFENNLIDSVSSTAATNNGTTFSPGLKGQALQIGLNNYAVFKPTAAISSLQSATIAFWMNTTQNTTGTQDFASFVDSTQFWGNLDIFLDQQTASGAVFHIHAWGSAGAQETFLTSWPLGNWGVWTHVVLTYDATANTFTFYLNGALVGSTVVANFGPLNFANFPAIVFGTNQFNTTPSLTNATTSQPWASYVLGEIDEFRIYNKALTATEARALDQLENLGE
jgi:hypothetical protein